jgi:hypothetical protein
MLFLSDEINNLHHHQVSFQEEEKDDGVPYVPGQEISV